MGKLVEKLQQVGQASSGGFGFLRTRGSERAARPAAVLVSLGVKDAAGAEAAAKNGVDGVIISGWKPSTDLSAIKAALAASGAVLGIEYSDDSPASVDALKSLQQAGADFAVLGVNAPAGPLFEDLDQFDLVIGTSVPEDDLGLVLLRAENLLPAQAVLVQGGLTNRELQKLTVGRFARLRLASEALRFPKLLALDDAPEGVANVRLLVRLGVSGLVLQGTAVGADALGQQVKILRETLETIPAHEDDRDRGQVAIGGLMEASGKSLQKPEPEPEKE